MMGGGMMALGLLAMLLVVAIPVLLIAVLVAAAAGFFTQRPVGAPTANISRLPIADVPQPAAVPATRYCAHCGQGLQAGWTHCPYCGAPISA
jgi:hypothetical protein